MPRKYVKYEPLDAAAADRIRASINDWSNPDELRTALYEKFPEWKNDKSNGFKRFEGFTKRILERDDWFASARGKRYTKIEDRTGTAGKVNHRFDMITDIKGKYLGKPDNVRIYSRHGSLFGLNLKTGRRAKIA